MGAPMESLLLLVTLLLSAGFSRGEVGACTLNVWTGKECLPDPRMNPILEQFHGRDFVWQIPEDPKAVLFIAHGGNAKPHVFFDRGPNCTSCYGLPEERLALLDALDRDYAVIGMKSHAVGWEPTWPLEICSDLPMVRDLVREWIKNHSLEGLPLFAFGHSSGGPFVTILPSVLPVQGVVAMCTGGQIDYFKAMAPGHYPPIFYVIMNISKVDVGEDIPTMEDTEESVAVLEAKGVSTVVVKSFRKQVTAEYLSNSIRCLTHEMAEDVVSALVSEGWLEGDRYVTNNPGLENWSAGWVSILRKRKCLPECKDGDELFLQEDVSRELTRAFAEHSFTSEWNVEVFDWLDSIAAGNGPLVPSHSSSR